MIYRSGRLQPYSITAAAEDEVDFVNRKSFHSLNVWRQYSINKTCCGARPLYSNDRALMQHLYRSYFPSSHPQPEEHHYFWLL